MLNKIPLLQSDLSNKQLYYHLYFIYICGEKLHYNFDTYSITYSYQLPIKKDTYELTRESLNITRSSWAPHYDEVIAHSGKDFVVLVPAEVMAAWYNYVQTLPKKSRCPLTRLFFYFYFFISSAEAPSWGHSYRLICEETGLSRNNLGSQIEQLVRDGWLERNNFFSFGQMNLTYMYSLPRQLWTEEKISLCADQEMIN